jgi:hypothetical protein
VRPLVLAAIALCSSVLVSPTSSAASGTSYGSASGSINLPMGGNGNGFDGAFVRLGGAHVFDFEGQSHELGPADPLHPPRCDARLPLQRGSAQPLYVVYGHWTMEIASGDGSFYAPIYDPDHVFETPLGRVGGTFHEPPGDPTPGLGTYQAVWGLGW